MSDFDTDASVSLSVPRSELRNVRQQIQDGIGTVEVGVTDGGSMSAQTTRSPGAGGPSGGRGAVRLAESQIELLEDAVIYLESIDDAVTEGGLLGGGGGGGLMTELFGSATETAGDVAVEAGDSVADAVTDVFTGTVSSALGNTISSAINGSELTVEETSLRVERPDWIPIAVEEPETGTDGPTGGPPPTPNVDLPEVGDLPSIDTPDTIPIEEPPTLRVDRERIPVEKPEWSIRVEKPNWIPIQVESPSRQPRGTDAPRREGVENPWELIGSRALSGGASGAIGGAATGAVAGGVGAAPGAAIGAGLGGISGAAVGAGEVALRGGARESKSKNSGSRGGPAEVDVTHSPTYNLDIDPRRLDQLATQIVDEVEKRVDRDLDRLRSDVENLEQELSGLERDITSQSARSR